MKIETHLSEPFEIVAGIDFLINQCPRHISFMDMFDDLGRKETRSIVIRSNLFSLDVPICVVEWSVDQLRPNQQESPASIRSASMPNANPVFSPDSKVARYSLTMRLEKLRPPTGPRVTQRYCLSICLSFVLYLILIQPLNKSLCILKILLNGQ